MSSSQNDFLETTKNTDSLAMMGIEQAKKFGADAAKITTSCSQQKKLVVENKKFTLANSLDVQQIRILVHKDQKKGSSSINTSSPESLSRAVADAVALASFSVADPNLNLPDTKQAPPAKPLNFLYNDHVANMDLEELQESMGQILGVLIKDPRIALDRFEMAVEVSRNSLFNSLGVRQSEIQSTVNWSWMGMAVDGAEVTGFDYDSDFSFRKEDLLAKGKKSAEDFSQRLIALLQPTKCPSYKGAVLLSPRAVESIITSPALYHVSGHSVMDGKSKWQDKIGQKVLSEKISILDNPHCPDFAGATSYDGDGLPTKKQAIIEKGILKTHLHDCYSAKKTGAKPTASSGGPFGLELAPGSDLLAALCDSRGELLLVDRFSGNTDPIKGDFSGVAKSSRLYRQGRDCGAVMETMIAGNFFDLAERILGVSQETLLVHGSFRCPWILVDGISVTGN
jgi:PmbA protein